MKISVMDVVEVPTWSNCFYSQDSGIAHFRVAKPEKKASALVRTEHGEMDLIYRASYGWCVAIRPPGD